MTHASNDDSDGKGGQNTDYVSAQCDHSGTVQFRMRGDDVLSCPGVLYNLGTTAARKLRFVRSKGTLSVDVDGKQVCSHAMTKGADYRKYKSAPLRFGGNNLASHKGDTQNTNLRLSDIAIVAGCPNGLILSGDNLDRCSFPQNKAGLLSSFGPGTTEIVIDNHNVPNWHNNVDREKIVVGKLPDLCEAFPNLKKIVLSGLRQMENFTMPAWLSKCTKLEHLQLAKVNVVGKMVRPLGARWHQAVLRLVDARPGVGCSAHKCRHGFGALHCAIAFRIAAPGALCNMTWP